jgi:predicted nucleotidyltransferase
MDTYKLKWTKLQLEIFRFLSIKSERYFSVREIANNLNVSPTAISKNLNLLLNRNFVSIKKSEKINLFNVQLNRDNQEVIDLKRVENLRLIYLSGLIKFLEDKFPSSTIILFGSYSRGEDVYDSDIDLAIFRGKEKKINLNKFEKYLEREININFYNSWKIDVNLKNNLLNGIVLSGSVEL